MKRTNLLLLTSAILVFAIIGFTFFGCSCMRKPMAIEGFKTGAAASSSTSTATSASKDSDDDDDNTSAQPLTPKEKELFEDLKNNRLSEAEITTLVQNNILNEQLVEKFLNKLVPSDDAEDKDVIEGFASVGNTYACAAFGADQ